MGTLAFVPLLSVRAMGDKLHEQRATVLKAA